MKSSVLICTRKEPAMLSHLTGDLTYRGIFPDLLLSETVGSGTVRIRLELECDKRTMESLVTYWKTLLRVQSVVVTSLEASSDHVPMI